MWRMRRGSLLIYACLLPLCSGQCPPEIGQPLDLDQFSGKWFFVAGTPVLGDSISRCGQFWVVKTSVDSFAIKYTAISRRDNATVTFNVHGRFADGPRVVANWQLEGSNRILGPLRHVLVSADYGTGLAMFVCPETERVLPGLGFSMIWSRERRIPGKILEDLRRSLRAYINQKEILEVDQSC